MQRRICATVLTTALVLMSVVRPISARQKAIGAPLSPEEQAWLNTIYAGNQRPLWIGRDGQPNGSAIDGLALLARAAEQGLDPADYYVTDLHALWSGVETWSQSASFEVSLSLQMLRYVRDVHRGRVDPRSVGFALDAHACDVDFPHLLRTAVEAGRLDGAIDDLAPPLDQYRQLRSALAHYRRLADTDRPEFAEEMVWPGGLVRPGDTLPQAAVLAARLVAFGDLPADAAATGGDVYTPLLVRGVRHFQLRHGLSPDGVIGTHTRAALDVPVATRVHQIELALERLRWLPPLGDGPVVALNVPMFRLWAWRATPASRADLSMNAIVGQALQTETPIFVRDMRQVVFRPYWNVPPSIVTKELLPIILRNPAYLEREGFEIMRGVGEAAVVLPVTPASLRSLRTGAAWLRQRPGPKNALGSIEFVFPNAANVYMHGTPARELFASTRRDFSHGCIRLEDPAALARWVLSGQNHWTTEAIDSAMATGPAHRRVDLARPVRVVIFYMTAAVMPEDGSLHFADDIYGHDGTLDRALLETRVRRAESSVR
jgi:murein L,D-transpeptidase YcbB/YkuD